MLHFFISINSSAEICFFGYTANSVDAFNEIYSDYGLTPNVGVVNYAQFKETALALNSNGAQAILVINQLIFETVPSATLDCSDYKNIVRMPNEVGLRLYEDWEQRLSAFLISEKDYLNSGNVMILGISDEVNNLCVSTSDVNKISKFIKSFDINVPTAVVYDLSVLGGPKESARPLPESFPESVDIIAVFEYGIFDPNDAENPLNATKDWAQRWDNFKSKLGSQKVVFVLNAFCNRLHVRLGWVHDCTPEYVKPFAISSYRWRDWALSEPDIIGIVAFNWKSWNYPSWVGTRDMHKVVQNSHQNIINAINCDYDGKSIIIK